MGFDLDKYETVDSRIKRFYVDHGDGKIFTRLLSDPNSIDTVVVLATLFLSDEPVSTGLATETKGDGYVNKTSHLENCETSAIGRALANYNYSGAHRPSREEMQKVKRGESTEKPVERADGPPQVTQSYFGIISTAATANKFGEDAVSVMTKAAAAQRAGDEAALKQIVEEWEL